MKIRRVLVIGLPYFGKMLAQALSDRGLEAEFVEIHRDWATLRRILRADCLYFIGGLWQPSGLLRCMRFLRKPVVLHWVGTDVLRMLDWIRTGEQRPAIYPWAVHWAESEWLAQEVAEAGIKAEVVYLANMTVPTVMPPLASVFRALTYLPSNRSDFYGKPMIESLARSFPDVEFLVAASDGSDWQNPPANLRFLGWVNDMDAVYREVTVLLRLPEHDGLSFMVTEALARGRHVLWSYSMPGVCRGRSLAEATAFLQDLLEQHRAGSLGLNQAGLEFVLERLAPDVVFGNVAVRLQAIVDREVQP